MLLNLTENSPGIWAEPATDTSYLWWVGLITGALPFMLLGFLFVSSAFEKRVDARGLWRARVAPALIGVALVLGSVFAVQFGYSAIDAGKEAEDAAIEKAKDIYSAEFVEWLEADYGIEADVDAVWGLVDGYTVAAERDGETIPLSLTTSETGSLVLLDESESVIQVQSK